MSDIKKPRLSKFSTTQQEAMVDFMELHLELRKGKFTNEFSSKMAESLWKELSELLNSLPGSEKDTSHWRKTWQDLKTTVKEKAANASKESNKTGGGKSSSVLLTALEQRVISLIGGTSIKGDSRVQESVVKMNWQSGSTKTNAISESIISNKHRDVNATATSMDFCASTVEQNSPTNPSTTLFMHSLTAKITTLNNFHQLTSMPPLSVKHPRTHVSAILLIYCPDVMKCNKTLRQTTIELLVHPPTVKLINDVYLLSQVSIDSMCTPNSPVRPTRLNTKQGKSRRIATQRMDNTIFATDSLIEAIQRKSEVKEDYYRNKLELMEANLLQQRRIATSLEAISSFLNQS